ncbi:oxygen-insensitive NADPH nitroreductase [Cytobacillus purgationiresistens]|uniref:FMN reductase (NADPH) n=1 Tax=Cytobacillus purgationiresistens TaxID=863449 RepID=A0ABU0AUU0_9BACI|nr:oxygen-insensitive NADPH nitroreductase [Cytobacillus purgationiresistens]MDQ0273770.1 FMN reductase (NADPH) [Cytobacillus purgationiresistens]
MNETIQLIKNHRSVRQFEDKPLTKEQIEAIVTSGQAASTSSFIQAYSIIGVTDQDKKKKLAKLAGDQSFVENNGHFLVFCADLHRHQVIGKMEKQEKELNESIESTEKFMVGLIDAALAAQNAVIAAESMGLGICYVGGIRNNLEGVSKVLNTPSHVIPLFGLAVGYPAKQNSQKPRLPFQHIYHENEYEQNGDQYLSELEEYNDTISKYYEERTAGRRKDTWTEQMGNMLNKKKRMYMKDFVQSKGLNKS